MFKSTKYPIEIIELAEIDSTNVYCKSLANKEPNTEKVVLAHFQRAGKGQFGNAWESNDAENLTFSVLFHPKNLTAAHFFRLNQAISLGVMYGIRNYFKLYLPSRMAELEEHLKLKWPNDVYISTFKIGGILIENTISGTQIEQSIVGIGLNVNQMSFSDRHPNAASLKKLFNVEFNRELLFDELISSLFKMIHQPEINLAKGYQDVLYGYKIPALYRKDDYIFKGIIQGIDEYGRLILLNITEDPPVEKKFSHKEVEFTHIFLNL